MDVISRLGFTKRIKLYLVFFYFGNCLTSCDNGPIPINVQVNYKVGKAISANFSYKEGTNGLNLFLEKELETPILGDIINVSPNEYSFIPIIPFTENQTYVFRKEQRTIGKFKVIGDELNTVPEILAIYPTTDTVPENLLKMYLKFSEPMQEAHHVLDYITVIDQTEGVEKVLFLKMEAELWNQDHDLLTLWLDPGRIKTDLIPNRELGLPILDGHVYSIQIDSSWRSALGRPLKRSYDKTLVAIQRDNKKPSVKDWKLDLPKANSRQPLTIHFSEPMDAILTAETISIYDNFQNPVPSESSVSNDEKKVSFTPANKWKKGEYTIRVKSILEDLAGNNLNYLFDKNLDTDPDMGTPLDDYTLDIKLD